MILPRFSMRTHVSVLVIFMGLLGLGLALLTGEYYRQLIHEHQRASLARIGTLKAQDALGELHAHASDFGLALQHTPEFRRAFGARDELKLIEVLGAQFHRYFVTANVLRIDSLYVLDTHFTPVARLETDPDGHSLCPGFVNRAAERPVAHRIKPFTALCSEAHHIHSATLVAIGGLRPVGYLAVVVDPTPALRGVERELGMPLRIRVGERLLSDSPLWPSHPEADQLVATTQLSAEGIAPLTLEFADNSAQLAEDLARARFLVMLLAGIATVSVTLVALALFTRCTLEPMQRLTERMRLVRSDRSYLGTQVEPVGNAEMRELADNFNELSGELKELHQTLESLAYNDPLTGLPNRVLFRDRLEQQMRLAERDGSNFAVLAIDLDRFKEINDTLGHHAGDQLLQQVSQRMRRALRRSDTVALAGHTVARLGGDEFCALLPAVRNAADGVVVAEKLLAAMEEPFELEGRELRVGMSIGVALYPEHTRTLDELCRCADSAMYQAKRSGTGYALFGTPPVSPVPASPFVTSASQNPALHC